MRAVARFLRAAPLPAALLAIACAVMPAGAQPAPADDKKASHSTGALLPGASSKEPVSIDAGKLDYFDKESKLVYTGDVVAKQGESTLRASVLTIFLTKDKKAGAPDAAPADPSAVSPASGSSIRRMEARGPVTIISKDEVGTGDNGSYDKGDNKITLTGNVTLTQATNVIKGDKLVYDMTSGQAQVSSGQTAGRVSSVFTPGSGAGPAGTKKTKATEGPAHKQPPAPGK
jgi:lipopolysaccharide export system protein LptA